MLNKAWFCVWAAATAGSSPPKQTKPVYLIKASSAAPETASNSYIYNMKKRYWFLLALVFLVSFAGYWNYPKLDIITGFSSKNAASCRFVDGRSIGMIKSDDNDVPLVNMAEVEIDDEARAAFSSIFGMKTRKTIYRDGLGCVLVDDTFDITQQFPKPNRSLKAKNLEFPYGDRDQKDTLFDNVDYAKLSAAVDNAFDSGPEKIKRSRAVIVIYKDKIIAEKYAAGFTKNSRILGWSMTKSVMATLYGILERQGKITIGQKAPIREWEHDNRQKITISDLLQMNSGLEWTEDYETISDVTKMLFIERDMSRAQLHKPAISPPGENWNYSSGTSNLLSGILRKQFRTHQEYLDFWYKDLIDRIGMHSMLIEADMAGNYVGSSYAWATPRDWAKFGLLYMHNGNWNGDQLFDKKWVDFVTRPTKGSGGRYGGHFWLNRGGYLPSAPRDMYSCNGFQGQRLFIIPSKDLVVLRMGLTDGEHFDFDGFLADILKSVR